MKIVQSFWSRPQGNHLQKDVDSRLKGGWPDVKYYYMSWALSCLQLCRFNGTVELVTDQAGKELLIDQLELPYTKVTIALDRINHYDANLWAMGKIYAYSLQDEPFLHVDSDLFVWKKFEKKLLDSPLIAQHLEKGYGFYDRLIDKVTRHIPLPEVIQRYIAGGGPLCAYNMGIVGGHDLAFIKLYSQEAIKFVDQSLSEMKHLPVGQFNTIYEQVLFFCLLHAHKKDIGLFTSTVGEEKVDEELKGLANFCKAPVGVDLIHLYGNCKSDTRYCMELENKLKTAYPEVYMRALDTAQRLQSRLVSFREP